jgi:hypothetical protein
MERSIINAGDDFINITELARRAGIPYATMISAALLRRAGGGANGGEADGWGGLGDVIWASRSMLAGNLRCRRSQEGTREVFASEVFCLVSGQREPVEINLEAVLEKRQAARMTLFLQLGKAN